MFAKFFAFIALLALVAADVVPLEAYGYTAADLVETIDVTDDGGVLRLVVKKGTGVEAKKGTQIAAHYDGKLLSDGKQFDSVRLHDAGLILFPSRTFRPLIISRRALTLAVQEAEPAF